MAKTFTEMNLNEKFTALAQMFDEGTDEYEFLMDRAGKAVRKRSNGPKAQAKEQEMNDFRSQVLSTLTAMGPATAQAVATEMGLEKASRVSSALTWLAKECQVSGTGTPKVWSVATAE